LTILEEYTDQSRRFLQHVFQQASKDYHESISASNKSTTTGTTGMNMNKEHAHQLWQAMVVLRGDFPDAVTHVDVDAVMAAAEAKASSLSSNKSTSTSSTLQLPSSTSCTFSQWLEACWLDEKARPKVSSYPHRKQSETLNMMRVAHYNENEEDIDVAILLRKYSGYCWTSMSSTNSNAVNDSNTENTDNNTDADTYTDTVTDNTNTHTYTCGGGI
jgi:hypothetical protein